MQSRSIKSYIIFKDGRVLSKSLLMAGCVIFFILGATHAIYTFADIWKPKRLVPHKPEVVAAMKASTLALTKDTDMWRAWVGFNISHSVGLILYGLIYGYLTIYGFHMLSSSVFLLSLAPIVAISYLILSIKYWFSIPAIGSLVGLLCFVGGITALIL